MHAPGPVREPLIEAFEAEDDWWRALGGRDDARKALGRLWNCTDVVPSHVRDAAVGELEAALRLEHEEAVALRSGCTYAQLVRRLRIMLDRPPGSTV